MLSGNSESDPRGSILVVFSPHFVGEWIRDCLRDQGHYVLLAPSAKDALMVLPRVRIDLAVVGAVLLDVGVEEFWSWIRANPERHDVPVVFVVPLDPLWAPWQVPPIKASIDAVLAEPLESGLLQATVGDALLRSRQLKRALPARDLDPVPTGASAPRLARRLSRTHASTRAPTLWPARYASRRGLTCSTEDHHLLMQQSTLATDPVVVAVKPVGVRRQDLEVPMRYLPAVQVRRRGRDAHRRIGRVAGRARGRR
jgi:DNA-binding response OmpR family regulator